MPSLLLPGPAQNKEQMSPGDLFSPVFRAANAAPLSTYRKGEKKSCFAERRRRAERKMWLKSCQKAIHPVQKLQGKALQTESSAAGPVLRGRHKAIRGCMANPAPWPSQHFWGWGNDSLWGKGCLVSSVQTDEMSEKLQVKSMTQCWDAVQWLAKRCPASCRLETALQLIHSES